MKQSLSDYRDPDMLVQKDYAFGDWIGSALDGLANVTNGAAGIVSAANNKSNTVTSNTNANLSVRNSSVTTAAILVGGAVVVTLIIVLTRK